MLLSLALYLPMLALSFSALTSYTVMIVVVVNLKWFWCCSATGKSAVAVAVAGFFFAGATASNNGEGASADAVADPSPGAATFAAGSGCGGCPGASAGAVLLVWLALAHILWRRYCCWRCDWCWCTSSGATIAATDAAPGAGAYPLISLSYYYCCCWRSTCADAGIDTTSATGPGDTRFSHLDSSSFHSCPQEWHESTTDFSVGSFGRLLMMALVMALMLVLCCDNMGGTGAVF